MNRNISEKGQALILIAFGIVALIGFTALAIGLTLILLILYSVIFAYR